MGAREVRVEDGEIVYCGRVNAKNSYGGYVGSRIYVATIQMRKGVVISGEALIAQGELEFIDTCREKELPIPS